MAEKTSEHFYSGNAIQAAVDSALAATKLDHRDASASVYKFFFQVKNVVNFIFYNFNF